MDKVKLSKNMSYILRHNPYEFNLKLDENGWLSLNELLNALKSQNKYKDITLDDIINIVNLDSKKRYQIKENKIRAVYGHSIKDKIKKESNKPPKTLYHGTTKEYAQLIIKEGLKPMSRQYVHLSEDINTANIVALRRTNQPVILIIDCLSAYQDKINFYKEDNGIWLSDFIPFNYISELKLDKK